MMVGVIVITSSASLPLHVPGICFFFSFLHELMLSFVSFVTVSFLCFFFTTVLMSFAAHSAQGRIFVVDVGTVAFIFCEKAPQR